MASDAGRTSPTLSVGFGAVLTTLGAFALTALVHELRRLGSGGRLLGSGERLRFLQIAPGTLKLFVKPSTHTG